MNSGLVLDMPGRQRLKSGGTGGIHDLVLYMILQKHLSFLEFMHNSKSDLIIFCFLTRVSAIEFLELNGRCCIYLTSAINFAQV